MPGIFFKQKKAKKACSPLLGVCGPWNFFERSEHLVLLQGSWDRRLVDLCKAASHHAIYSTSYKNAKKACSALLGVDGPWNYFEPLERLVILQGSWDRRLIDLCKAASHHAIYNTSYKNAKNACSALLAVCGPWNYFEPLERLVTLQGSWDRRLIDLCKAASCHAIYSTSYKNAKKACSALLAVCGPWIFF